VESKPVYKILIFLKRKAGTTPEQLRDYYESRHARLCEKYAKGALRYVRRYVTLVPLPGAATAEEKDFDVITEIWTDSKARFEATVNAARQGIWPPEVIEDEERVFDRSKSRFATVVECDSDLSTL